MWLGKFTVRAEIKGYNILLTDDMKIPADGTELKKQGSCIYIKVSQQDSL